MESRPKVFATAGATDAVSCRDSEAMCALKRKRNEEKKMCPRFTNIRVSRTEKLYNERVRENEEGLVSSLLFFLSFVEMQNLLCKNIFAGFFLIFPTFQFEIHENWAKMYIKK